MRAPAKSIRLRKAMDMLRLPGHRLMKMNDPKSPNGKSYYLVPGGYVDPRDAEKIIQHPEMKILDEGLLDDSPQSWCMVWQK